ncbi:hypothetical protein BJP39_24540 [Streptomyces sp. CC77]|nr:hypothetical protein BJP39_24540 [Streptomyces sp. CC77]
MRWLRPGRRGEDGGKTPRTGRAEAARSGRGEQRGPHGRPGTGRTGGGSTAVRGLGMTAGSRMRRRST